MGKELIFRANRKELCREAAPLQRVISSRCIMPVLGCILCRVENGKAHLRATDIDRFIKNSVVAEEGAAAETAMLIPANIIRVLEKNGGETVEFFAPSKNDKRFEVVSGRFKAAFPPLPAEDFPEEPGQEGEAAYFSIQEAEVFLSHLAACTLAVDPGKQMAILRGVRIFGENRRIFLAATEGHIVIECEMNSEALEADFQGGVLPRADAEIAAAVFRGKRSIDVAAGERFFVFRSGDLSVQSKALDGNFPNYRQVIPGNARFRVAVDPEELCSAMAATTFVHSGGKEMPICRFDFIQDGVKVSASGFSGECAEVQVASSGDVPDCSMAFNAGYLGVAGKIFSGKVEIRINGAEKPVLIETPTRRLVVMPIRNKAVGK